MKRRSLLKLAAAGSTLCATPFARVYAAPEPYDGRIFVTVQAAGAWDVTSFCDPKLNVPGELEINHWAQSGEIQTEGNILFAPFGNNNRFFQKYKNYMMVINGVDSQTNAHTVGETHTWSGRNSAGYPSLTSLFAKANAPDVPMSYINFGGYGETAKIIRSSRLDNVDALLNVLQPNAIPERDNSDETYRYPSVLNRIQQAQQERLKRHLATENSLPRKKFKMEAYYDARANSSILERFASVIPPADQLQGRLAIGQVTNSNLLQQVQIAVLAFKSGVSSAADFFLNGFDTHSNHDRDHEPLLSHLLDGIDYLWDYAEELGIADRLTVMISSDFGRTPFYNDSNGKDHWPVTSAVLMEKDAPWGNRVIGLTDEGHNALSINPGTLQRDDSNGTKIYPKHIHKAVRDYLGIGYQPFFPFNNTEDFDFFNADLQTADRDLDPRNTVRIG